MNTHSNITNAYRQMVQDSYDQAIEANPTLTEAASFYRLPGYVVGNDLYAATKQLKAFTDGQMNGNDFDVKLFAAIIDKLNKIKKEAKAFNSEDDVPVSYMYKKK